MGELQYFECPNCGGRLEFDSASQKLKCPYCDGVYDPDTFGEEKQYTIENSTWDADNELSVYACKSCGGAIMVDANTVATSCPYCGDPVVLQGNVRGDYKPSRIIPFALDKKAAKREYRQHLKGKFLLPKAFTNEAVIDEIKGVYVPFWLFDGTANAQIWYDATKVRHWSDSDYNYTETSYYKLFRSGRVSFEEVPVDASSVIDDDLTQSIEPFDSREFKEFNANYLAGYLADKYDIDAHACQEKADERIANSTRSLFASTTAGYSSVIPTASRIMLNEGRQEYVMMPMWLLNVKYDNKNYKFAMNGQTGKFVGDLPVDKVKMWGFGLGLFAGVSGLLILIQYLVMTFGG
ncbi:MAG: hypothetical protein IKE38_01795 [Erysipelotrichaceae bacterium]|nr:hypothetical protein [Erysipelotrichaceae bacterium]